MLKNKSKRFKAWIWSTTIVLGAGIIASSITLPLVYVSNYEVFKAIKYDNQYFYSRAQLRNYVTEQAQRDQYRDVPKKFMVKSPNGNKVFNTYVNAQEYLLKNYMKTHNVMLNQNYEKHVDQLSNQIYLSGFETQLSNDMFTIYEKADGTFIEAPFNNVERNKRALLEAQKSYLQLHNAYYFDNKYFDNTVTIEQYISKNRQKFKKEWSRTEQDYFVLPIKNGASPLFKNSDTQNTFLKQYIEQNATPQFIGKSGTRYDLTYQNLSNIVAEIDESSIDYIRINSNKSKITEVVDMDNQTTNGAFYGPYYSQTGMSIKTITNPDNWSETKTFPNQATNFVDVPLLGAIVDEIITSWGQINANSPNLLISKFNHLKINNLNLFEFLNKHVPNMGKTLEQHFYNWSRGYRYTSFHGLINSYKWTINNLIQKSSSNKKIFQAAQYFEMLSVLLDRGFFELISPFLINLDLESQELKFFQNIFEFKTLRFQQNAYTYFNKAINVQKPLFNLARIIFNIQTLLTQQMIFNEQYMRATFNPLNHQALLHKKFQLVKFNEKKDNATTVEDKAIWKPLVEITSQSNWVSRSEKLQSNIEVFLKMKNHLFKTYNEDLENFVDNKKQLKTVKNLNDEQIAHELSIEKSLDKSFLAGFETIDQDLTIDKKYWNKMMQIFQQLVKTPANDWFKGQDNESFKSHWAQLNAKSSAEKAKISNREVSSIFYSSIKNSLKIFNRFMDQTSQLKDKTQPLWDGSKMQTKYSDLFKKITATKFAKNIQKIAPEVIKILGKVNVFTTVLVIAWDLMEGFSFSEQQTFFYGGEELSSQYYWDGGQKDYTFWGLKEDVTISIKDLKMIQPTELESEYAHNSIYYNGKYVNDVTEIKNDIARELIANAKFGIFQSPALKEQIHWTLKELKVDNFPTFKTINQLFDALVKELKSIKKDIFILSDGRFTDDSDILIEEKIRQLIEGSPKDNKPGLKPIYILYFPARINGKLVKTDYIPPQPFVSETSLNTFKDTDFKPMDPQQISRYFIINNSLNVEDIAKIKDFQLRKIYQDLSQMDEVNIFNTLITMNADKLQPQTKNVQFSNINKTSLNFNKIFNNITSYKAQAQIFSFISSYGQIKYYLNRQSLLQGLLLDHKRFKIEIKTWKGVFQIFTFKDEVFITIEEIVDKIIKQKGPLSDE